MYSINARHSNIVDVHATLTKRSQTTIPARVRQVLSVDPEDQVTFRIDLKRKQVTLLPARSTLEAAFGAVKPLHQPEDFKKVSNEAREEHIKDVINELQKA